MVNLELFSFSFGLIDPENTHERQQLSFYRSERSNIDFFPLFSFCHGVPSQLRGNMWSGGNGKSVLKSLHLLSVSKVLPTKYMSQYEEVNFEEGLGPHSIVFS